MPNDTTKSAPGGRAELNPCPFCGDPFQVSRGGLATHINQVDCIIGNLGFPVEYSRLVAEWNTRTPPQVKPLVWVCSLTMPPTFASQAPLFGRIRIEDWGNGYEVLYSIPGFCDTFMPGTFRTSDDAKAAAQADYTRRILDALA